MIADPKMKIRRKSTPKKATKTAAKPPRKSAWTDVIRPQFDLICTMYARGATKAKLARFLGIPDATFRDAEKRHEEFRDALERAKIKALDEVRGALYRRAVGYENEKKIIREADGRKYICIEKIAVPPDVSAAVAILKNAGEWSDNPVVDNAIAGALSDADRRARACAILGIPNAGDRSTAADEKGGKTADE